MRSWAALPTGKVVRLEGADAGSLALALDPLPEDAPVVLSCTAPEARSPLALTASILDELDAAALGMFPAWLPDAEGIDGPGGAGVPAVRTLALRTAATTAHFGPFLAELAERALRAQPTRFPPARVGRTPNVGPSQSLEVRPSRFPQEVRAAGLARALAAAFSRAGVALLVDVPEGLSPSGQEVLVAAGEWLAHRAGLGVWLAGPLPDVDRVETVPYSPAANGIPAEPAPRVATNGLSALPAEPAPGVTANGLSAVPEGPALGVTATGPSAVLEDPALGVTGNLLSDAAGGGPGTAPRISYPPVAGKPHPGSAAEQALEAALGPHGWAAGRAWNQTIRPSVLSSPVRADLVWQDDRCVVEVDGPDHLQLDKFTGDRARDVRLQIAGYAVLRFTDVQVLTDPQTVVRHIELFLRNRRVSREG